MLDSALDQRRDRLVPCAMTEPLLSVRDLNVDFRQAGHVTHAVRGVSFDIGKGETVALVGESGSGKSVTALSVMKLLPYPAASHPGGEIRFKGKDLLSAPEAELRRVRGADIGIVFQEPMTSLNPLHTIERQVGEVLKLHQGMGDAAARKRVLELLDQVGIPNAEERLGAYPHQLSGGQRQRVMIAMALANEPDLLHRRRADHRPRRDGPGADPRAASRPPGAHRHGDAVHHPRPRHRPQDGEPGLRHDRGRDRRGRPDRGGLHPSAARLYPASAGGRAEGRSADLRSDGAGGDGGRRPQGLVSDQARAAAQGRRPHQGGRRHRHRGARGTDARHRRRVRARARPPSAWR